MSPSDAEAVVRQSDSPAVVLGESTATVLAEEIGVRTVGELIRYAPLRYLRRGEVVDAAAPEPDEWVTLVATVSSATLRKMRNRRGSLLAITATDGVVRFSVTFFNPHAIARVLKPGVRFMVAGTVSYFRGEMQLTHPEWLVLPTEGAPTVTAVGSSMLSALAVGASGPGSGTDGSNTDGSVTDVDLDELTRPLLPIYPATRALQTWTIWFAIRRVLAAVGSVDDPLSPAQRRERGLPDIDDTLRALHTPDSESDITRASTRLTFDEALALQAALAQRRFADSGHRSPVCPHVDDGLEDRLVARLPFTLTQGQREVIAEIDDGLAAGEPMSRLLQGEVGSGKTLAALLCMLRVIDNGHQCVLLAPTEVLAAQHFRTLTTMLGPMGSAGELGADPVATRVTMLTGSMRTSAKRTALLEIVNGDAGIVVGTHALLEEKVDFFDLGLIVVDEQHRFGVEQRDALRGRGRDGAVPHMLVMTATPIPRTVAMTVYGDLDTSTLRELPAGRAPIATNVVPQARERWEARMWEVVAEEATAGRQVYVVCSRIGDDGTPEGERSQQRQQAAAEESGGRVRPTTSAIEMYEEIAAGPLGRYRVELLHGRLPADEKAAVMDAFGRGEVDILVATTVIEVGVDVANATTMVVVDADRFGVSQLHQLRGRVGRGGLPGRCFLRTTAADGSPSMERLRAVAASNDGFELARIDLVQRREGDVLGALQSGDSPSLRHLSLVEDADVIADARELATAAVRDDLTLLEHRPLADLVDAVLGPSRASYLGKS